MEQINTVRSGKGRDVSIETLAPNTTREAIKESPARRGEVEAQLSARRPSS